MLSPHGYAGTNVGSFLACSWIPQHIQWVSSVGAAEEGGEPSWCLIWGAQYRKIPAAYWASSWRRRFVLAPTCSTLETVQAVAEVAALGARGCMLLLGCRTETCAPPRLLSLASCGTAILKSMEARHGEPAQSVKWQRAQVLNAARSCVSAPVDATLDTSKDTS
jgi:hypothetical protein